MRGDNLQRQTGVTQTGIHDHDYIVQISFWQQITFKSCLLVLAFACFKTFYMHFCLLYDCLLFLMYYFVFYLLVGLMTLSLCLKCCYLCSGS